jgi:prephenate dehydratase
MAAAPRIGFQGVAGAFSESALRHWWPEGEAIGYHTFAEVITALLDHAVDHAVLPVENLIAGPVHASLGAITSGGGALRIADSVQLPIELCLVGLPETSMEQITVVMSHPVALAQCTPFLMSLGAEVRPRDDTAGAAREVAETRDITHAAISSALAADRYGLSVLARGIQSRAENWTRFVRIDREPNARSLNLPGQ